MPTDPGADRSGATHHFSLTPMARPQQCVPAQWPSGRRLAAGDVLSCELSTSWGVDYPGQLLRTSTVAAEPGRLVRELHDVAGRRCTGWRRCTAPARSPRSSSRPPR